MGSTQSTVASSESTNGTSTPAPPQQIPTYLHVDLRGISQCHPTPGTTATADPVALSLSASFPWCTSLSLALDSLITTQHQKNKHRQSEGDAGQSRVSPTAWFPPDTPDAHLDPASPPPALSLYPDACSCSVECARQRVALLVGLTRERQRLAHTPPSDAVHWPAAVPVWSTLWTDESYDRHNAADPPTAQSDKGDRTVGGVSAALVDATVRLLIIVVPPSPSVPPLSIARSIHALRSTRTRVLVVVTEGEETEEEVEQASGSETDDESLADSVLHSLSLLCTACPVDDVWGSGRVRFIHEGGIQPSSTDADSAVDYYRRLISQSLAELEEEEDAAWQTALSAHQD